MRVLLDTQVVLWALEGRRRVSGDAAQAIRGATDVIFSAVSFGEIGVKVAIGKLAMPPDLPDRLRTLGVRILPLDAAHGLAVAELPLHHRDPFDRLLVAQARLEGLTLVTSDRRLTAYDVPVVLTS